MYGFGMGNSSNMTLFHQIDGVKYHAWSELKRVFSLKCANTQSTMFLSQRQQRCLFRLHERFEATIHCVILRERVIDGPSLYGGLDASWAMELQSAVAFYQSYFNYTYGDWFEWRASKVETSSTEYGRRRILGGSSEEESDLLLDWLFLITQSAK